jgi:putative CocE/NonD family hydrolase
LQRAPVKHFAVDKDVDTPMRDGVVLRMDLWGAEAEVARPAILVRTPYEKSHSTPAWFVPRCVLEGYVFAIQDCRGHFASDGETDLIMWPQEARDTYDTIEWMASQPWCDGNIGMIGGSYMGIMQWAGAALRPPHLRAIAPAMSSVNGLGEAESGGVPHLHSHLTWLLRACADWLAKQAAEGRDVSPALVQRVDYALGHVSELVRQTPLSGILTGEELPVQVSDMIFSEDRRPQVDLDNIDLPTLSTGGWIDALCYPTLALHDDRVRRDGASGRHRLVMGPWTHGGTAQATQGEIDFGPRAPIAASGVPEDHLAFFDEHLRGRPADRPAVRYFLMGANEWRHADTWPPPGVASRELFLHSGGHANTAAGDGRLSPYPATTPASDRFTYDPDDPVPTHGGKLMPAPGSGFPSGPLAQNVIEARNDVLCYSADPLDDSLDIVGPVSLQLYVSSDVPDTDFMAKLIDVFPDGRAIALTDGAVRARHRNGPDHEEEFLRPGKVEQVEIVLGHTAWRFAPGHRVRVDVTSSNFPHLDRNMNTGGPVGHDVAAVVAHQMVWHDADRPSRLSLSVLEHAPDRPS